MKMNKRAFKILTTDEQASLALQKIHGKSSWQAGEILKRSHYKYLEISQRAQRFFELFTLHYNTYDNLIPIDIEHQIHPLLITYLQGVIEKRLTIRKAVDLTLETNADVADVTKFGIKKERETLIANEIIRLGNRDCTVSQNTYSMIMEFDRYNNFRVLPPIVQEPSAFKRRNKTRFRKHLDLSTTIHPYALDRLKEIYKTHNNPKKLGYVALINNKENFRNILTINALDKNVAEMARLSLYVFNYKEQADEYIALVTDYLEQEYRDPRKGLEFWPKFRNLIKLSLNYDQINNIIPSRKGLITYLRDLDNLYAKRDRINKNNKMYKD